MLWSANGSTWVTGTENWVGTRPYVGVSFQGSNAFLEFSGSSSPTEAHQSVRFRVSTVSMPTDATTTSATAFNTNTLRNYSTTTGSFSDGETLYVKALFYSGTNGTGDYNAHSATLYKNGDNTTTGSLIWRPVYEVHAWDGSAWRRVDTQITVTLTDAYGLVIGAFEWQCYYTLNGTAPSGWKISVKTFPGGIETGPFDISGTSSGIFSIFTDSSETYEAQLLDDTDTPIGDSIIFTPT
jgi:hypothetical protein